MKLHLPNGLRAALFACFASVAAITTTLATATVTAGTYAVMIAASTAEAADYQAANNEGGTKIGYIKADGTYSDDIFSNSLSANDTLIFGSIEEGTGNLQALSGWLPVPAENPLTCNANLNILGGLTISEASPKTIVFAGNISGDADITVSATGTTFTHEFKGDMTDFRGNISVTSGDSYSLKFTNTASTAKTINAGTISTTASPTTISGSYNIASQLTLPALTISSGTTTLTGTGSTVSNLTLAEGARLIIGTGGELTLGGTVVMTEAITNNGSITLSDGMTFDLRGMTFTAVSGQDKAYSAQLFAGGTTSALDVANTTFTLELPESVIDGFSYDKDNGTLTYTLTVANLTYGGGTLTWTNGGALGDATFNNGDMVTFSGSTTATLGSAVSSTRVIIAEGAALSLSNGDTAAYTLTTTLPIINNGTLTLLNDVLAADTKVAAESTGTVVFAAAGETTLNYSAQLSEYTGAVNVQSGRLALDAAKSTPFSSITVNEGAQLQLKTAVGSYSGAITIAGAGTGTGEYASALLLENNTTLTGTLTVADAGASIHVGDSATAKLGDNGTLAGTGDLAKEGNGTLFLRGNVTCTGDIYINGGELGFGDSTAINDTKNTARTFSIGDIHVASGATLMFCRPGLTATSSNIYLDGGTLKHVDTSNGNPGSTFNKLILSANSALDYFYKGKYTFAKLTGNGNLTIGKASVTDYSAGNGEPHYTIFNSLTNYTGLISITATSNVMHHALTINGASQAKTTDAAIVSVATNSTNFSMSGKGSVAFNAGLTNTGALTLNGGTLTATSITTDSLILNGGTLTATSITTDSLILNGGTLSATTSLTVNKQVSMNGGGSYTGTAALTLGNGATLSYSALTGTDFSIAYGNLGEKTLVLDLYALAGTLNSSKTLELGITGVTTDDQLNALKEQLTVGGLTADQWDLAYTNEGKVSLSLVGDAELSCDWDINWGSAEVASAPTKVQVYDADNAATSAPWDTDLNSDTYALFTATEADNKVIYCCSSSASATNGRNMDFDTWVKVTGGDFNLIVGGNNCSENSSGGAITHEGDSHIYVAKGGATAPVIDYIIGGNYKDGHGAGVTGSAYITLETNSLTGSIIGGNTSEFDGRTSTFTGNTYIYIYTPQTSTTDPGNVGSKKPNAIVGGNAQISGNSGTQNFVGDTNILLDFTEFEGTATMSKVLIGGSLRGSNGTANHTGNTNVTIRNADGVTFSSHVIGGSWAYNSTASISGISTVDISGGTYGGMIIGGSYDDTQTTHLTNGGTEVKLSGGTFNGIVIGGNYDKGTGSTLNSSTFTGDINVTISGTAVLNNVLYGGSYAQRNTGAAACKQQNITVNLEGGSILGDVYAAGYKKNNGKIETRSTTVNITSAAQLGNENKSITVNGGYHLGNTNGTYTISGDRTLAFTSAETYSNLSHVSFADFNVVDVVQGGIVNAVALTAADSLTKRGEGTLGLSTANALSLGALTTEAGTLDLTAAQLTVNDTLTLEGGTLKIDAESLTLGTNGTLTLDKLTTLDLGDLGDSYEATILSGVTSTEQINGLTFAQDADTGIYTAAVDSSLLSVTGLASLDGAYLKLDGGKLILTNAALGNWVWDSAEGGVWSNDSHTGWASSSGEPSGKAVSFTDTGIGEGATTATVTIDGEVTPASVEVNVSAGKGYTFTATNGGSISGAASLTKDGEGSLTISNANAYTGDTTIKNGTLTVGDASALGTSEVKLNGGELVLNAAIDNKVSFGGGTLHYSVSDDSITYSQIGYTAGVAIKVAVDAGETVTWTANDNDNANLTAIFGGGLSLTGDGTLKLLYNAYKHIATTDSTFTIDGKLEIVSATTQNYATEFRAKLAGSGSVKIDNSGHAINLAGDNSAFTGTLTLTGTNTYTLNSTNTGGSASKLVLSGATVSLATDATVAAGTLQIDSSDNKVSGTGTFSGAVTGNQTLIGMADSHLTFTGSMTDFTGILRNDGTNAATFTFSNANAAADANLFGEGARLFTANHGSGPATFVFDHDNTVLMNATVQGTGVNLTQNGTGTLVITKANSSAGGVLTVNAGTVQIGSEDATTASWGGTATVAANGTLHLVTQGAGKVGAVTSTGKVVMEAGTELASLTGGDLTVNGNASVTSTTGALRTLEIAAGKTLTTSSALTVATLKNDGSIALGDKALSVNSATDNGGAVTAGTVTLTGDNSFTSITASGAVTAAGALTLAEASSMNSLSGVTALTTNGTTTVATGGLTLTDTLSGTGSLVVSDGNVALAGVELDGDLTATTGNVSLGADASVGGALTVGGGELAVTNSLDAGALSGVSTISLVGTLVNPGPAIDVTGAVDSTALTFIVENADQLTNLGLGSNGSYTLLAAGSALDTALSTAGNLGMALGETTASNTITIDATKTTYTIALGADGKSIVITSALSGDGWQADDGVWGGDADEWGGGTPPSETKDAFFSGGGNATVTVDGDQTASAVLVDTSAAGDDDVTAYTFTGDKVTTQTLTVTAGGLTIANETTVNGTTVVGSINGEHDATLAVTDTLTTDSMTVHEDLSTTAGTGFSNTGTTEVTGALTATDKTIGNTGTLSFGEGSSIGTIDGSGAVTATGDSYVGTVDGATKVTATENGTLLTVNTITGGTAAELAATDSGTLKVTTKVSGVDTLTASDSGSIEVATLTDAKTLTAMGSGSIEIATATVVDGAELSADGSQSSISITNTLTGKDDTTLKASNGGSVVITTLNTAAALTAETLGTVEVTTLTGSGSTELTASSGGSIEAGTVTGSSKVTASGANSSIDISSLSGTGMALAADNSGKVTIDELTGSATITAATGAEVSVTTAAGSAADSISTVTATDASTVTLTTTAENATISTLTSAGASSVTVAGAKNLTVDNLLGGTTAGSLDASGSAVTLTNMSTAGVSVTAQSLDLTAASGSSLGTVTTDALTLDLTGAGKVEDNATALLSATQLTTGAAALELTLDSIDTLIENAGTGSLAGDYLLVAQSAVPADATLDITLKNEYDIVQAIARAGLYDAELAEEQALGRRLVARATTVGKNVVLRVEEETERVWNTSQTMAGALDLSALPNQYDWLTYVTEVNVDQNTTIDLTEAASVIDPDNALHADGMVIRDLTTENGSTLTLKGTAEDLVTLENDENSAFDSTLTIEGVKVQVRATDANHEAILSVGETVLGTDATLNVLAEGNYETGKLSGTAGTVAGTVSITGNDGSYSGNYDGATINMTEGATQTLAPKDGLTVTGEAGTATLDYAAANAGMDAINTTGAHVTLLNGGDKGNTTVLELTEASSMEGGTLAFNVNMDQLTANIGTAGVPVIVDGELALTGTTLDISQADSGKTYAFDLSQGTTGLELLRVSGSADADVAAEDITVNSTAFNRYFRNAQVVDGVLVADLVTDYYGNALGETETGKAGFSLIDHAALTQNPQGTAPDGDLAKVLDALDDAIENGNRAGGDKIAAALAGASSTVLGSAFASDVERQLKTIRNRTTTMGVDQQVMHETMPYFNAWINAEGDYHKMDADGELPGYTLSSWGGTVGMDADLTDKLTAGLALTAMYGDLEADAADTAEGDLDTYYVSAFARYNSKRWVHTFVASVGRMDATLERTVNYGAGSYKTEGETEGLGFGLMYEVGYTMPLNEDASACWQPVFNVTWRHVDVDAYEEDGSDAGLSVGEQSMDAITFGLGARMQAVVGENLYERTSILEARALLKVDAGDRESAADVALLGNGPSANVSSAERGAVGVELGVGLTIPVSANSGSVFFDASADIRSGEVEANATVGYRVNF